MRNFEVPKFQIRNKSSNLHGSIHDGHIVHPNITPNIWRVLMWLAASSSLNGGNKIMRIQHITFWGDFTIKNCEKNPGWRHRYIIHSWCGVAVVFYSCCNLMTFTPEIQSRNQHLNENIFLAPKRNLIWHLLVPFKKAPKTHAIKSSATRLENHSMWRKIYSLHIQQTSHHPNLPIDSDFF